MTSAFPILTAIMASADPPSFDSAKQFDDLLDLYVGRLEARIGEGT